MKKNVIYLALLCAFIMGIGLVVLHNNISLRTVATDSGWDSDYDSGGGWDSGGSSWDSSYDSDSSYSYSSNEFYDFLEAAAFVVPSALIYFSIIEILKKRIKNEFCLEFVSYLISIIIFLFYASLGYLISCLTSKYPSDTTGLYYVILTSFHALVSILVYIYLYYNRTRECEDANLVDVGIDNVKELKEELYKNFVDVQKAWMEFDYKALSKLCSDELYNSYKSDLEILKQKNGKNIMNGFNLKKINIVSATIKDNCICLKVYLHVRFYDYVINEKTNEVIRGYILNYVNNKYMLEYTKKIKTRKKCPSCGCKILDGDIVCPACGTNIINNSSKFVLTHKEKIN